MLSQEALAAYPGGDLVAAGLVDLGRGIETIPALLVSVGAVRLRAAGLDVPPEFTDPERRLYDALARELATFFHYDFMAQALAKLERGHARDRADVREMLSRGLVDPARARDYFASMEPELYRFPAIDPPTFRRAVDEGFPAA